eukprot:6968023-Pyramimonas_sp.AAC.1
MFEDPLRDDLLVLSHGGHQPSALPTGLQNLAVAPNERIPPRVETTERTGCPQHCTGGDRCAATRAL